MGVVLIDTVNNLQQFRSDNLAAQQARVAPGLATEGYGTEVRLSLEQLFPLLQGVEIPVVESQRIVNRRDLRNLKIQYPCHLRAPGVDSMGVTVTNRIDAIAACQTLFSRKVKGAFPDYLLVEADVQLEHQLSLAIFRGQSPQNIIVRGAYRSGLRSRTGLETAEAIECLNLQDEFALEDGSVLAERLGFQGAERDGIAELLDRLYTLMLWAGITGCYLDSLALGQDGQVMPLRGDCTFGINSPLLRQAQAAMATGSVIHASLLAHKDLVHKDLAHQQIGSVAHNSQNGAQRTYLSYAISQQSKFEQSDSRLFAPPRVVRLGEGKIALISNGYGRTMATLEQFQQRGGSVAAFVSLPDGLAPGIQAIDGKPGSHKENELGIDDTEADAFTLKRQLSQALRALARLRDVKVILINWRSAQLPCRILADALVEYQNKLSQRARRSGQPLSLVVRLVGEGVDGGHQRLLGEEIEVERSLDSAIARTMGLARMGRI